MARGENIYKRKDGRWEGRYPKARKADGSIYYGYIYGRSYRSVREQILEKKVLHSLENSTFQQKFQGTFGTWAIIWLNQLMKDNIKESTYSSYQNKLSLHILPVIGNTSLHRVDKKQLEQLVDQLKDKLSPASIHITFRLVKSCLKAARDRGYLYINPAEQVSLPKIQKEQVPALNRQQHTKILKESKKSIKGLPVVLALETGMRIGEISALRWEDVDFEQEMIHVRRTKQRIFDFASDATKTKLIETAPKTKRAKRAIPMTPCLKEQLICAKSQAISSYVVESHGKSIEPRTISYRFERIRTKVGILNVGFHALRHTFATRCVELGISINTISALLGHASIKMTLDTYTYSFLEDQRQAMDKLSVFSS
ncbi:tyrosine-type recombinase/integrase [Enterococcus ureasiticus]|uniref:tyrosine-type recombinase/integrase n=1 Tax=Enterococcus ureasiticus TaxID=903984 RepID=UPI000A07ADB6|nr:site-specific integrase [Enterococcus ureasiticus]